MIKKILLGILAVVSFTACYQDKGNYDYRFDSMNDIDVDSISFTPGAYESRSGTVIEIQQPNEDETKRIEVNLTQTLEASYDNLDFFWTLSYTNSKEESVTDSVYTVGYVDLEFPAKTSRQYSVKLIITDRTTTLKYYKVLTVKTRPIFTNSLFILHEKNGERLLGNVEEIGDNAEVRLNAFQTAFPDTTANPFSKTVAMAYMPYFTVNNAQRRAFVIFNNDGTGKVFDPYGLTEWFSNIPDYVLPQTGSPVICKQIIGLGNYQNMAEHRCLIDRQGRYYAGLGRYPCFVAAGLNVSSYNPDHQTDYNIATGTIMQNYMVFWDSKNERFLYQQILSSNSFYVPADELARTYSMYATMNPVLDAHVDLSGLSSTLSPRGKRAVYAYIASKGNEYASASPFFIFRDDNTGKYYLYTLTSQINDKDSKSVKSTRADSEETTAAFTISAKELPYFEPGENNISTIMYSQCFSTNYVFYANGGYVYRYNTSNGEVYTVYSAPEGYSVSCMKFRTTYSSDYSIYLGRYLDIALEKNGTGAVVTVKLDTSSDVDATYESKLYDGVDGDTFGPISDIQFVHDFIMDEEQ